MAKFNQSRLDARLDQNRFNSSRSGSNLGGRDNKKMTTINLYQNEQVAQKKGSKSGLFFTLGIFIFTLLVLAGFKIAVGMLQKQNETLAGQISTENKSLIGLSNIAQVIDMQARLKEIKNNLQINNSNVSRIPMTQILEHVGDSIDSTGVFLTSYKYEEGNKISLTLNANSFSDAAKQVFNFKNSKYFSNVSLNKIGRGEKYVTLDVDMSLKQ